MPHSFFTLVINKYLVFHVLKTKYDTLAAVLFLKFIAAEKGDRPDLSLAVRSIPGQP